MKTILDAFANLDLQILKTTGIEYAVEEITLNENTYIQLVNEIGERWGNDYSKSDSFDFYISSGKIKVKKSNKQRIELLKVTIERLTKELNELNK